jgi:hypothetical protein
VIYVTPDPALPVTFDSFVEQYMPRALEMCHEQGRPEFHARLMAESMAHLDIEVIRDVMTLQNCSAQEALQLMLKPQETTHDTKPTL